MKVTKQIAYTKLPHMAVLGRVLTGIISLNTHMLHSGHGSV